MRFNKDSGWNNVRFNKVVWHCALEYKHITDTANTIGGHKIRDGEGTFEEPCFIFMACLNSRESNKEHGYMSEGTVIC